jgi:phosphate transport system substrate-binding protein
MTAPPAPARDDRRRAAARGRRIGAAVTRGRSVLAASGAAALCAALAAPAAPAATVDISGSSTTLPLVADLAWFYRHDVARPPRFTLVGGGTDAGVADAARGIVDIGLASRAPRPTDPPGVLYTPFAASGVCLVTNTANPVTGITRAQLTALVAAHATSWTQVPGSARTDAILSAGLALGTGARSVFLTTFIAPDVDVREPGRTFTTASQTREYVRANPGAWSYVDLAFTAGLHVVPFEGVACTRATVADRTYPGRRELAFVTRGAPRGAAARFIRWVRTSRVARRVIATRYVPVR